MNLISVCQIDLPEWIADSKTQKLMEIISGEGGCDSLFVGGCVRNQLIGKVVEDIDITTKYPPEKVIEKLTEVGIKVIPTGIKHGTVTAVVEGRPYEITTLRRDDVTDGRHAEVSFTEDWLEDARRRDFTMNTLLMDMRGNVYDPTGRGMTDLKARHVIFVGDPKARIEEDYLRILRFFRFHAFYGQEEMEEGALRACAQAADKISTLSRERITSEFLKIISVETPSSVLQNMFENRVLYEIVDDKHEVSALVNLCGLQAENEAVELMSRLFVLMGFKSKFHDDVLRLTHAQKNFLVKLEMAFNPVWYVSEKTLKKAIYHYGNILMLQGYLLVLASSGGRVDEALLDILKNWQAPKCPITGEMLLAEGYVTGPDLGLELSRRQEEWLEEVL